MRSAGVKRKHAGFVIGHGYNSVWSGNFWTFLGVCSNKLFHFYRPFSGDWHRLTRYEALELFDIGAGRKDKDYFSKDKAESGDYPDIETFIKGGRI